MSECAIQVEAEKDRSGSQEEPLFDDAALPPVIESHGLW